VESSDFSVFLRMCKEIQHRGVFWIQGTGGNLSVKDNDILWIKGSGKRLDSISGLSDLAPLKYGSFVKNEIKNFDITDSGLEEALNKALQSGHSKPSMETPFHAILPFKWVCHFHSLTAIVCYQKIKKDLRNFLDWYAKNWRSSFGDFALIEKQTPGLSLSREIFNSPLAQVYFLQNHGVILASNSVTDFEKYQQFESELFDFLKLEKFKNINDYLKSGWSGKIYFPDLAVVQSKLKNLLSKNGNSYFLANDADTNLKEIFASACVLDHYHTELTPLNEEEVNKIESLPTEKHRISMLGKK
jgi:ribulose-5-phosphate 4-epimerase/fuculose-1-phosphate aldolase